MNNYETMTLSELKKEQEELKTLLADTEEDRDFMLGQTGNHVPGSLLPRFAAEIEEITANIEKVTKLISSMQN